MSRYVDRPNGPLVSVSMCSFFHSYTQNHQGSCWPRFIGKLAIHPSSAWAAREAASLHLVKEGLFLMTLHPAQTAKAQHE
jgi:hypothetical protein